ncbi:hypothetical protein HK098_006203 [Nowakowskiella sp. JEL0407]|nr:hypothetical protein HK098_006203 [Nowakowskiella sp. JEL0407]
MSSQTFAKISFNGILRQTKISTSSKWDEFETVIRNIHGIPSNASILVTYKDSDGDVIALDTDRELYDAVNQAEGGSIRFEVNLRDPESASFVVVNPTSSQQQETMDVDAPSPKFAPSNTEENVVDEEDSSNSETRTDKGKQSSEGPSSDDQKKSSSSSSQPEPTSPFTSLYESLAPIMEQVQAEIDANPEFIERINNLFTQAGESLEEHMEPIMKEITTQINEAQQQRSYYGRCRPCGPRFYRHPMAMYGSCSPYARFGGRAPHNWNSAEKEPQMSEETFEERVKQVEEMGFGDREVIAELLRRYDGNVTRAIEVIFG